MFLQHENIWKYIDLC